MKFRIPFAILLLAFEIMYPGSARAQPDPEHCGLLSPAPLEWRFAIHFNESIRLVVPDVSMTFNRKNEEGPVESVSFAVVAAQDVPPAAVVTRPNEWTSVYQLKPADLQALEAWRGGALRDVEAGRRVTFGITFNAVEICLAKPFPPGALPFGFSVRTIGAQGFRRLTDDVSPASMASMNNLVRSMVKPCKPGSIPEKT